MCGFLFTGVISKTTVDMFYPARITAAELRSKIRNKETCLIGNSKLKIFGTLHFKLGKQLQRKRAFFGCWKEAIEHHHRPYRHCIKTAYKKWKDRYILYWQYNQFITSCKHCPFLWERNKTSAGNAIPEPFTQYLEKKNDEVII